MAEEKVYGFYDNKSKVETVGVEHGIKGAWEYIKYSNGIMECWTNYEEENVEVNQPVTDKIYYKQILNKLVFPFEFIDVPTLTATNTGSHALALVGFFDTTTTNAGGAYVYRFGQLITADKIRISIRAIGHWK